ncbi:D-alanyl-D-alanine carboxypeptidase family protein [Isoptericola sp. NPDC056578]|uniref:M15 family metallopeptidase n=1 Tax=Isoptericola sp. NPDC056578 TaxID=3345870 RepID=UPI003698E769
MTQTQPAPAPTRTYPSRRDPGRGGRSRSATAVRHVPEPVHEPVHQADAAPAAPAAPVHVHAPTPAAPAAPVHVHAPAPAAPAVVHVHAFDPVRPAAGHETPRSQKPRSETARPGTTRSETTRSERRPVRKSARKRVPGRLAGLGVGLTVAVATTTTLTAIAPQAAAPEPDDQPTTGSLESITAAAAAAVDDRAGGASRSGARAGVAQASAVKQTAGGATVTVSNKAKMSVETLDRGEIEAAPPVLPGCEGFASGSGSNGQIPSSELCTLWDGRTQVRADAAVKLAELNEAYKAAWGESMCITDGFRSYAQQVATKAAKGYLAAVPGTSNHGWGLAVDICPDTYSGSRWAWLAANAPAYGWDNPDWARPGGSKYEPWHWEYTAGVTQMGGY